MRRRRRRRSRDVWGESCGVGSVEKQRMKEEGGEGGARRIKASGRAGGGWRFSRSGH